MNQKVIKWKAENPELSIFFEKMLTKNINPLTLIDFVENDENLESKSDFCFSCQKKCENYIVSLSNNNFPIKFCTIDCIKKF